MDFVTKLWLAILLSGAAVWVWSFLCWAILPNHKGDFKKVPNEEALLKAMRELNLLPGQYMYPNCSHTEMKDPDKKAKVLAGPMGMLNVWPNSMAMGGKMLGSFLVYLAVSAMVAYISHEALEGRGPMTFMKVFQMAGSAGILGYCFAFLPGGIWFNAPRRSLVISFIEGVIAGLITGAIFAAFWPPSVLPVN